MNRGREREPADFAVVVPEGWLSRGEAFVRGDHGQLAVFGGIPGERARVKLLARGGHQDRARFMQAVGRPDPSRVDPSCERYAACGRCPMMHLDARGQERARRALLDVAFSTARAPVDQLETRGPAPLVRSSEAEVLHALELTAGWSDQRHSRIGVPGREGNRLVPIPECVITTPRLRAVMSAAAHHMQALEIWPYHAGKGSFRGLLARHSATTDEVLITLVFAKPSPHSTALAEAIAGQVTGVAGAVVHWNDAPEGLLSRDETGAADASPVYGRPWIEEEVPLPEGGGVRVRLGAFDPYPTHPRLGARLWTDVVDALAPTAGDTVVDLAAGGGALTLLLARRAGWALGVDPRENVVRRARENAAANGISAEFVIGTPAEALEGAKDRLAGRRPLVVADTGARGLDDETVAALAALAPRRVALVSTNPRALATDVARLAAQGLPMRRLVPYDTAPNTPFGDTLALLVSPDTTPPALRAPRRKRL